MISAIQGYKSYTNPKKDSYKNNPSFKSTLIQRPSEEFSTKLVSMEVSTDPKIAGLYKRLRSFLDNATQVFEKDGRQDNVRLTINGLDEETSLAEFSLRCEREHSNFSADPIIIDLSGKTKPKENVKKVTDKVGTLVNDFIF